MDDERLASELERRSRAASPRPDWARHDLLPAVLREIDARPQPVLTSRWSPRLGVAAVVAALLIMVLVVPRLVPAPPTSSSSPTESASPEPAQSGVLSTADFASRLATGELDGETVLVDGRIGPNARRGPVCPLSQDDLCYVGTLEGSDVDVYARPLATTEGGDALRLVVGPSSWPWWNSNWASAENEILVLSIDASKQVEYVGSARTPEEGVAWSVVDAKALDVNSIRPDEVVLVDGWLVETEPPGTTINFDCVLPRFPRVDGLPYDYCLPHDYLSSEQPVGVRGFAPDGAAHLSVQRNAAQLFGARIQDGTSLFAIAPRLYGGCFDAPTCWQWDVIARVDSAQSEAVPRPSPSPVPSTPSQACEGSGLPISISDPSGLVVRCAKLTPRDIATRPGEPTATNPDGDLSRLRLTWRTSGCATSASVSVMPNSNPPLFLISAAPSCVLSTALVLGVELTLSFPIDAASVGVRFDEHVPEPTPTVQGNEIECPPTWTSGPDTPLSQLHATIDDLTGLIASCSKPELGLSGLHEDGQLWVGNPSGDRSVLQVEWAGDPCNAAIAFTFRRSGTAFSLEGRSTYEGQFCILPLVVHIIRFDLTEPVDAASVSGIWVEPTASPSPTRSPAPIEMGSRVFNCASSEALGDPGITLVDHSGRIGACSMAQADLVPEGPVEVSTTRLPGQLAVDWVVNTGCPGDERMEFWGPVEEPIGLADYFLQVAHTSLGGETCNDLPTVRRVELGFTELVRPADIQAFVTRESLAENTTSNTTGVGSFDLLLSAPLNGVPANEPIDITASLKYIGSADPVTLSGWWRPDFAFLSLTGGPSLHTYGSILLCPDAETQLTPGGSIVGGLQHPRPEASGDSNNAYYDEYAYDGQFRLPAGTYLIFMGVGFNVGSDCHGDRVALRTAIVIHVGGFAVSPPILHTAPP